MRRSLPILVVEKDNDYAQVLQLALRRNGLTNPFVTVSDGQEAIDYLCGQGKYANRTVYPFPIWIFTELRLPRVGGFGLLEWLKKHPECSVIPVVVLSVSDLEADIRKSYVLGANSYIIKPKNFDELIDVMRLTFDYWDMCSIPKPTGSC